VLVEKYEIQRGSWCYEETRVPYRVGIWRNIRNGWGASRTWSPNRVWDGSRLRFWHDVWCEKANMKSLFPKLVSLAREKDALVSDYLDSSISYAHWAVQDWELESLVAFLDFYSLKTS
jgi:hypothetical protein